MLVSNYPDIGLQFKVIRLQSRDDGVHILDLLILSFLAVVHLLHRFLEVVELI
jgi:hypothetical protein